MDFQLPSRGGIMGNKERSNIHALRVCKERARRSNQRATVGIQKSCRVGVRKMKDDEFRELVASIEEAGKIQGGESAASCSFEFPEPDVKAIREGIGFSQSKFAALIGVNVHTLQNWEQGHRHPTGPAKVLLRLVQSDPMSVMKTLHINA
jgi:putative transcriptional regulator